jgi:ADP-ribose pyrophosphatase YjhB (NUDIX family)
MDSHSLPHERFRHCPQCGSAEGAVTPRTFDCHGCGFHLHFNATVSASALVVRGDGAVLFIRRARQPAQGKLAVPGGFIDPWERAEVALVRELQEEVGLEVEGVAFLGSWPNDYHYKGLIYPVCDLFFVARPVESALTLADDEALEALWLDPKALDLDELAFPSMRAALAHYRERI